MLCRISIEKLKTLKYHILSIKYYIFVLVMMEKIFNEKESIKILDIINNIEKYQMNI